ncbi:MAG: metal ABC transporter ATP-binding protein [Treponema sp.]|jgi:zinc transport system ATP-binding protein|nr:metal ABC transporter ATP-binding protein [Treponema sp.]
MNNQQSPHPANREIAVQFDSVSFAYGDVPVLENASFHIHRGEFAALVGPNGSGKTTVLKLILGLEQPAAGRITLFGAAKGATKNAANGQAVWRNRPGYVPQQPPADRSFPVSVRDVVRMGLLRPARGYNAGDRAAVDEAMEQAGISELAAKPWRALSGGQRRRALVARALAARSEILVLDEPTANMDAESEARLFETLGKLKGGATILIVTHDMDFVSALTGRVLCLGDNTHHRSIVQHRVELTRENHHGDLPEEANLQMASVPLVRVPLVRVLHGENIPDDDCCENGLVRQPGWLSHKSRSFSG